MPEREQMMHRNFACFHVVDHDRIDLAVYLRKIINEYYRDLIFKEPENFFAFQLDRSQNQGVHPLLKQHFKVARFIYFIFAGIRYDDRIALSGYDLIDPFDDLSEKHFANIRNDYADRFGGLGFERSCDLVWNVMIFLGELAGPYGVFLLSHKPYC